MEREFNQQRFERLPIVGIVRSVSYEDIMEILPIYIKSGLGTIEITLNSPHAVHIIKNVVREFGQELNIGAGTVCNIADLDQALEAGASFIVSPIIDDAVIQKCRLLKIPVFPGAMTPTEIYRAWNMGATMVKVFPAKTMGAEFFRDMQGPLNQVKMLATGGINLAEMDRYWVSGARGFGIGSPMFPPEIIERKDWQLLHTVFCSFETSMQGLIKAYENLSR